MRLKIHDVGHGACISLLHENGNSMVWDCGHTEANRPSIFLRQEGFGSINRFFVTNYDEDHISDLPNLRRQLPPHILHRNTTIDANALRQLKRQGGPISPAMESMLDMIGGYNLGPPAAPPDFPNVSFSVYWNSFDLFDDTNNCSLVTVLNCNGTKFIIPGDIEEEGWQMLLQDAAFQADLRGVNVFVASHHGRESGYCSDVFDICSPSVVVFTDDYIRFATQEMATTYGRHCSGIQFNGARRSVLSTRNDGSIWWNL